MKIKPLAVSALLLGSAISLSACSTLKGAGIGAAGGAAATGGSVEKGAAVGGAGGAAVGTVAD
jgi:osmotically inducible lipoprotein OsmB